METAEEILSRKQLKDTLFDNGEWRKGGLSELLEEYANQAIKQALPLILEHVAENVETNTETGNGLDWEIVDKESITSQKEEILKLLGIE